MKPVFILVVVSCILALSSGDSECDSDYCKRHPCPYKIEIYSCPWPATVYRPDHVGKCACCPACVTLLEKGDLCKTYDKELGLTPTAVCREPLRCYDEVCAKFRRRV